MKDFISRLDRYINNHNNKVVENIYYILAVFYYNYYIKRN